MALKVRLPKFKVESEQSNIAARATTRLFPKGISSHAFKRAWDLGYTGDGILVAVIDTGVDGNHPDLKGKVTKSVNFTGEGLVESHGTHVAGTIAANGWIVGGAPNSKIMDIKVLAQNGGTIDNVVKGIVLAADSGATIINMSLGARGLSQSEVNNITNAITMAWNKGTICIAAAGNGGTSICSPDPYEYPASIDRAESIAACNVSEDLTGISLAYFSEENDKVDLAACGVNVVSTVIGDAYAVYSGTSMATPHVSAMAAVLAQFIKQKYPKLVGATFSANLVSLLHANVIKISSCAIRASSLSVSQPESFKKFISRKRPQLDSYWVEEDIDDIEPNEIEISCVSGSHTSVQTNLYLSEKDPSIGHTAELFGSLTGQPLGLSDKQIMEQYANISFGLGFLRYQPSQGPMVPTGQKFYNSGVFLGHLVNI